MIILPQQAAHLYESDPLNAMITTMTAQVLLAPLFTDDDFDADDVRAAARSAPTRSIITASPRSFKNATLLRVPVKTCRGVCRRVSVKVFDNMQLHITGTHSVEMLEECISIIVNTVLSSLPIQLCVQNMKVTMVNYSYSLPGRVNLTKLSRMLTDRLGVLVIFDPSKYAGANVKMPFGDVHCSILVFESSKMIISTPRVEDRDKMLRDTISFIEQNMVQTQHWEEIRMV